MKEFHKKIFYSIILLLLSVKCYGVEVGVYYYPGWKKPGIDAWEPIRKYPERMPLLGWYREGEDKIIQQQLSWMEQYGITYIAYDWYWDKKTGPKSRTYAIDAYLRNSEQTNVKFALLWANHTGTPQSTEEFDSIVTYWLDHYFNNKKYLTINGLPVVFVFSSGRLENNALAFGTNTKELLDRARKLAIARGFKGIYFVGSTGYDKNQKLQYKYPEHTYDAISAYNYQAGVDKNNLFQRFSTSYSYLSKGYKETWGKILTSSSLPYIIPVTSGWDRRPWGGSQPLEHDLSYSTPEEFGIQIREARKMLKEYPEKTVNNIVICCWNEFGEGSYIEPTQKYGLKYLEEISKY
ncbi:glycoside hydrolase family 99-like domain-containing protein [Klebsiella quasipneumoniae]|uniref:glycoside hydrolase family 99-like domain-containing protein n=1 Tax=Klebsiella pneumoniae complex TaxID=3390273 RepID=UPI001C987F8A|nr:glycoside hydrolase family 99-like domain-containing protein [Klebsiella quasipneumoniae]HBR1128668.1 glycoside hydrolase family 99-like domain-containing protein [Klebsiella quasipneumoniae subsp. similipneumoniae]HBR1670583.1 glycoside hydrolase family 99-like domain-containing protein [Klebsiella quasipneumoniae subsp. quasipneumoniae]HBR2224265.1 glycoside hydrolase family 99-like domain-containing protein [Klebsiella pneumoniae]MDR4840435.1 glycoside hydrolase family 99-like domain-cont